MPDKTTEEYAQSMTERASANLGAVGQSLRGVGGRAMEEWKMLTESLSAMPGFGVAAADRAAKLRADTALPLDHRTKTAGETIDYHRVLIDKHQEFAQAADRRFREEIEHGLLPKTVKDEQRALVQREVEMVLGNARGQDMVRKAIAALGQDPRHDAELLSSFGQSLFRGHGVEKQHADLRAAAVERWLVRSDGSERQIASRKALQTYRAANVAGAISAYHHSAKMHLDRDTRPQSGNLVVSKVTARGGTVKR
jgi:hypothetical protein